MPSGSLLSEHIRVRVKRGLVPATALSPATVAKAIPPYNLN